MKLRKKVSLLCSLVLVLAVGICSAILIDRAGDKILNLTYANAQQKQQALVTAFTNMLTYYHDELDSSVTSRSLMKYCFSQVADAEAVLKADGETLCSSLSIDPGEYLTPVSPSLPEHCVIREDGRRLLIAGSTVLLYRQQNSPECLVYLVQDITSVYDQIHSLIRQFAVIGAVFIGLGVSLIALLVRRSLLPLQKLQTAASHIAAGNYTERAAVSSADEVGALAKDFNTMAASVEQRIGDLTETAERQRLFIGGVTHEFKTPLTALLLNVDSLQNTCMREDEQAETLDRISQQSRWLEQLVQKLLKLITLNQLPALKPVSVPPLLDRVRDNTEASLSARGITLETCCTVDRLNLDADLMQSVLVNLVDNAAKASSAGQTVMLSVSPEGFTVQDRGCGIPQDEINRITEPFYMVDRSRSKKTGGMGLGLALVKEIVAAHGGTLEIKSEVGAGTTARVLLKQS